MSKYIPYALKCAGKISYPHPQALHEAILKVADRVRIYGYNCPLCGGYHKTRMHPDYALAYQERNGK